MVSDSGPTPALAEIPDHMKANGWGNSFDPAGYEEAVCGLCQRPIYRYQMDIIVEWKHFSHAIYCSTDRAVPRGAFADV